MSEEGERERGELRQKRMSINFRSFGVGAKFGSGNSDQGTYLPTPLHVSTANREAFFFACTSSENVTSHHEIRSMYLQSSDYELHLGFNTTRG